MRVQREDSRVSITSSTRSLFNINMLNSLNTLNTLNTQQQQGAFASLNLKVFSHRERNSSRV